MSLYFEPEQQQRRDLHGEAPAGNLENEMMRALLGERPLQQGLEPYQGVYKVREHITGLQDGLTLGHYVIGDMSMSRYTISMLFPMIEVAPSVSFLQWTIEHFRPDIAPIVPEEAPFAEHRFRTEPRYAKLQRRGTAISMTADIMDTDAGLARINTGLVKMAATMLHTFEYLTIQMLVTAHDGPMFRNKMALGKYDDGELLGQIEYDMHTFCSYARDPRVNIAEDMSDVSRLLGEYVPPPYAVLFPAATQKYMQGTVLERPDTLKIQTMDSQRQILQLESMPSTLRLGDGLGFPVKDHTYGERGRASNPLLRSVMIAEHYPMQGVECNDLAYRTGHQLQGGGFATCQRDRQIYDITTDKYTRISFQQAFAHSDFAPQDYNAADRDMFLADAGRYYNSESFGRGGAAHPQLYYENGIRYVEYFGQYRPEIVSAESHRLVGGTIAAAVRMSQNDAGKHLQKGMRLVRELARAPHDDAFLQTLARAYVNLPRDQAPFNNATQIYRQGSSGYGSLDVNTIGALITEINRVGTPPYMASLGGVRLLATIGISNAATGRAASLGMQAKKLLDAARDIYEVLYNVFPQAIALNPAYRPVNYQMPDGFATFFSTVFLNSTYRPMIIDGVLAPFAVPPDQVNEVAATLVDTGDVANPAQQPAGFVTAGSALNPMAADPDAGEDGLGMFAGARSNVSGSTAAHARAPWVQHELMRQAQAHQGLRAAGRQLRRGGAGMDDDMDDDEDDVFGTARTAFRNAVPVGYGIEGAYQRRGRGNRGDRPLGGNRDTDIYGIPADSNFRNAFDAADAIEDQLIRVCTMAYLTAPCTTMADFMRMMDADILVPFNIMLSRVALELLVWSLIVVAPGMGTAFHAIANTVVDFGKNVDYQMRRLTFSVTHAPILISPDHVAILPSRMPQRYVAGGGTRFFEDPSQIDTPEVEMRPDLISFVVPMNHEVANIEPQGNIDVDGLHGPNGTPRFPGAIEYERIWRLSDQAVASRAQGDRWNSVSQVIPNYSAMGRVLSADGSKLLHDAVGHRRGGSHPGCRGVWNGRGMVFPHVTNQPLSV